MMIIGIKKLGPIQGIDLYGRIPYDEWLFKTSNLISKDFLKPSIVEAVKVGIYAFVIHMLMLYIHSCIHICIYTYVSMYIHISPFINVYSMSFL